MPRQVARALLPALCAIAALTALPAHAEFPERPLRLIVPFTAGASADVAARFVAARLKDRLGQSVVVDNRPGATGIVAAQALLNAPADGYTLMLQSTSITIAPALGKLSFNVQKDLAPIARIASTPYVVIVGAKSPYRSLEEFIEGARREPGKLSCATYGIGSPPHIALELVNQAADVKILHVPYRASTLTDLSSGVVDCAVETPTSALIHAQGKTGRALGVTAATAVAALPEATPIAARYPGTGVEGWIGLFAPARAPAAAVARVQDAVHEIVASPDFARLTDTMGLVPVRADTPQQFSAALAQELARFARIVQDQKISAN